jgi:hypothetical protein
MLLLLLPDSFHLPCSSCSSPDKEKTPLSSIHQLHSPYYRRTRYWATTTSYLHMCTGTSIVLQKKIQINRAAARVLELETPLCPKQQELDEGCITGHNPDFIPHHKVELYTFNLYIYNFYFNIYFLILQLIMHAYKYNIHV